MSRETLVSTRSIREGMQRVEQEVTRQRRLRAEADPFFRHVEWVMEEMRAVLREAERDYRPTSEVAGLTGWSEETLRRHAKAVHEGRAAPREWAQMVVRRDGNDWTYCIATVPIKRAAVA